MDPPRWNEVRDRTPVTLAELDRAAATAEKLLRAVGLRDEAAPTVAEATVVRRKAFALFMRVYARARAAVQYLRAEVGDADEIAPSLYAGRVKHRKPRGEPPQGTPAPSESGNDLGPIAPPWQLAFLSLIRERAAAGEAQFVIATHSPILLAYPGSLIYELGSQRSATRRASSTACTGTF